MSPVSLVLLGALVLQLAAAGARAETEIVCGGPLPGSQGAMERALQARRHLFSGAVSVVVRAEGGHTVVRVGSAQREVELGGLAGEDAARMVAVPVLDPAQAESPAAPSAPPS